MGTLRELFGSSKTEVWKQLSEQIGGSFVEGGFWQADKVVSHVDAWTITLDTYSQPVGRAAITYTRLRAPYINKDGFRFIVYNANYFSGIERIFGLQDIEIGDPDFDAAFIIKANDAEKAKALFADATLRAMMLKQPEIHLEVKDDEGWFSHHFPEGVDELYFQTVGIIEDVERLKALYNLFAEVLHQLCHIGSAYESDPKL